MSLYNLSVMTDPNQGLDVLHEFGNVTISKSKFSSLSHFIRTTDSE